MLSVDCWRHIIRILGYPYGDEIISLSLVCKNAYKAVRENGTQFLRWKMTQDFVTSLAQHRYPWFKLIRAVTVCYDDMSFVWTRTERGDIDDYKVVLGLETGSYSFDGAKHFIGMKRLHVHILHEEPHVAIESLPDGLESLELSHPNYMTTERAGETSICDVLPSTLQRLVLKINIEGNVDMEMPSGLKIFKSKSTNAIFQFMYVPENNKLESLSIVTSNMYRCPHEYLTDGDYIFPNVRKLNLNDTSNSSCSCKCRSLFLMFPALRVFKTHHFYYSDKCMNRKQINKQKYIYCKYSHVRVEFK